MFAQTTTMSRRALIGGASATLAATPALAADWEPSRRYPDPLIEILDPKFERLRIFSAGVERLATGMRWCEGPVWFGDGRYLLWSDIPNNRIMKYEEATGAISVFREPSNNANGNCRDREGRLITCEHLTRRVTRTQYDGTVTVVCDRYDGKRLNSPNDVTTHSDGSVWFTDPPFGIAGNYIGDEQAQELPPKVYRVDPSGKASVVADDLVRPNGICFSPDEKRIYIVESRGNPNRLIKVYDVVDNGTRLANGRVFVDAGPGTPDGFRCDVAGNLWCGWGTGTEGLDGVMVFSPEGKPVLRIRLPEVCANLSFGGPKRNRLFMAAGHSLYSLYVQTQGARIW
jgi:gluconolactonase